MPVQPWARALVEDVLGGAPVEIGKRYLHPDDGPIEITSGQYWGQHGLSNFWDWRVLATGLAAPNQRRLIPTPEFPKETVMPLVDLDHETLGLALAAFLYLSDMADANLPFDVRDTRMSASEHRRIYQRAAKDVEAALAQRYDLRTVISDVVEAFERTRQQAAQREKDLREAALAATVEWNRWRNYCEEHGIGDWRGVAPFASEMTRLDKVLRG